MNYTTERALSAPTVWTDYWMALQNQYDAEARWMANESYNMELTEAYLDACAATELAWALIMERVA